MTTTLMVAMLMIGQIDDGGSYLSNDPAGPTATDGSFAPPHVQGIDRYDFPGSPTDYFVREESFGPNTLPDPINVTVTVYDAVTGNELGAPSGGGSTSNVRFTVEARTAVMKWYFTIAAEHIYNYQGFEQDAVSAYETEYNTTVDQNYRLFKIKVEFNIHYVIGTDPQLLDREWSDTKYYYVEIPVGS